MNPWRAAASLLTGLLLATGCATSISTKPVLVTARPPGLPSIGVSPENIRATDGSLVKSHLKYAEHAQDFFATVISESQGAVGQHPLRSLQLDVFFDGPVPVMDFAIEIPHQFFSLVLFPLAFIPNREDLVYTSRYTLTDSSGETVFSGKVNGAVQGRYYGWYVGRTFGYVRLVRDEAKLAIRNSARQVLNDIFAHAPEIVHAVPAARSVTPTAAGPHGVAVIALDVPGLPPQEVLALADGLRQVLLDTGRFRVVSRDYMNHVLNDPVPARPDAPAAAQVGKRLDVEMVIDGTVTSADGATTATLRLIETASGRILATRSSQIPTDRIRFADELKTLAEALARDSAGR